MGFLNLGIVGHWLSGNSYTLIFIAMVIEGPVITAAAAFAAALGYLNVWGVFGISLLGNIVPDVVYYLIGYWGREKFVGKYGRYLGITKENLAKAEKLIEKHSGKSLIAIKLLPLLATPGLIVAGVTRMDVKKFAFWSTIITIPSSLFYLIIGYYFGAAYTKIIHYVNIGGYIIVGAAAIVILIVYLQRKYSKNIMKKIDL